MNGYDLQKFNRTVEYCNQLGLKISTSGENLVLTDNIGLILGYFSSLDLLAEYIHGFQEGLAKGKNINFNERTDKKKK